MWGRGNTGRRELERRRRKEPNDTSLVWWPMLAFGAACIVEMLQAVAARAHIRRTGACLFVVRLGRTGAAVGMGTSRPHI